MNRKIFDHTNPFTAPEGYFDTLQDRIMERIQTEESFRFQVSGFRFQVSGFKSQVSGFKFNNVRFVVRTLVAAAACILFIFASVALYTVFSERQSVAIELAVDDDFYRWVYTSEGATLLAESLEIDVPEYFNKNDDFEEDDAIISFLERDNISVAAIAMLMIND
jgi:hypothetical protein